MARLPFASFKRKVSFSGVRQGYVLREFEVKMDKVNEDVSVEVMNELKGLGVRSNRFFPAETTVVSARGVSKCLGRTSMSVETAAGDHILMDEPAVRLNHSCQPTTRPVANEHGAYDFVAVRDIERGEEITFDYAVTETEVVQPFPCDCGSDFCRNMVMGKVASSDEGVAQAV